MSFRRMRHVKAREVQGCDVAYDFSVATSLYDATSGGSLVAASGLIARLEDLSGNGNHMTQGTSGKRPTRAVAYQGGLDAGLFSGAQSMNAGNVANMRANPVNVVGVIRRSSGNDGSLLTKLIYGSVSGRFGVFWLGDAKPTAISQTSSTTTGAQWQASSASTASSSMSVMASQGNRTSGTNAAQVKLRINGAVNASGTAYTDAGADANPSLFLFMGTAGDNNESSAFLNGHIGQAAKYSAALSDALYRRIELAMARKWRIAT
jgi:hypothetical protein